MEYNLYPYNLLRMEIETIQEALRKHKGENMIFIAKKLGISDKTLAEKCKKYGINHFEERGKTEKK